MILAQAGVRSGFLRTFVLRNWGVPFIAAYVVLMAVYAWDFRLGLLDAANGVAVYALYFFVAGAVAEVLAWARYDEGPTEHHEEAGEALKERREVKVAPQALPRMVVVAAVAVIVVSGFLIAAEWVPSTTPPGFPNNPVPSSTTTVQTVLTTSNSTTSNSTTSNSTTQQLGPPPGYPAWPQNSTVIAQTLCRNGTVQFWVAKSALGPAVNEVALQALDICNQGQTSGGPIRTQGDWYYYGITIESLTTATRNR